jgi:hypothetical protein
MILTSSVCMLLGEMNAVSYCASNSSFSSTGFSHVVASLSLHLWPLRAVIRLAHPTMWHLV